MFRRKACLGLAVSSVLFGVGMARAEDAKSGVSLDKPIYLADTSRKPLMAALDKAGAASTLDSEGINITGFVDMGWTYNFDTPNNHTNNGRVFDFEDQDKNFNQADIQISRAVDASKHHFDLGFNIEMMYGSDARLIHSKGLNFYGPEWAGNSAADTPSHPGTIDTDFDEEFDLTQANLVMALPFGNGLTVTAGKFVTLLGYEYINPTLNPFYSRSFLFGFAIPFTHTGITGKYQINDQWTATLGAVRGWETSSDDNNGSPSGIGQVTYAATDKLSFAVTGICGPEQASDTGHYRTVIDVVGIYKLGDNTTIGANIDYGYGSRQGNDVGFDGKPGTGDWWGAAVYVSQKIDPHFTFNVRGEYFNDDDGCRGLDTTVYELTAGLAITPMPDNAWASGFVFRPEIRWDHANNEIFNDAGDRNQFTVGGDIIFAF